MSFVTPYVTDKFTAYKGDVIIVRLSMALRLVDDYAKKGPLGHVKVKLKEGDINANKNLSGYYLFTDLTAGNYTVVIEPDLYFPEEITVDISSLDPKNPVIEIVLKPRPAYPFPGNATLLRGLVSDTGPVVNAVLKVVGKTIETITDKSGEFVLYFKEDMDGNITFEIKKYGYTKSVDATIKEWETISMGIISFP